MTKQTPDRANTSDTDPLAHVLPKIIMEDDSEILQKPRTYHRQIELTFEELAKHITLSADDLATLFKSTREWIQSIPDRVTSVLNNRLSEFHHQFARTPEFHNFLQLVDGAWIESPTEVVQTFKQFDREKSYNRLTLAGSLLTHAEKQKGELRAEYTIHAAKRVSESLYQPFMRAVLRLFYIANKRVLPGSEDYYTIDYGRVYSHLRGNKREKGSRFRDIYPNLLYQHAVLIRNAEAHENWDYYFDTDQIEVRNINNTERRRFKTDELLECAWHMLKVSGVMFPKFIEVFWLSAASKSRLNLVSEYYDDLLNDLEALTSSDSNRQEVALQNLQKRMPKSKEVL